MGHTSLPQPVSPSPVRGLLETDAEEDVISAMKINFDGALPEVQDAPGKANNAKNATTTAGPSNQK
jgi:hypothetical protein